MVRFHFAATFCLLTLGLYAWQVDAKAASSEGDSQVAAAATGENSQEDAPKEEQIVAEAQPAEAEAADEKPAESTDDKSADESDDKKKDEPASDDEDKNGDSKEKKSIEEDTQDEKRPKAHTVERKPLKIEAEVDGVFVAREMEEVALRPETWTQFKVVEAVEHGAQVKKGDVLVRFDDEKIEAELADEMLDQQLGELAMIRAEEEYPREKRLLELSYEQAQRKHDELLEDYEIYKNTDRPFFVKVADYRYQEAQENLASQQEELEQLEKMYEADELTEETEAIVLRRQRFQVETAELILKLQAADRDFALNVQLPRRDKLFTKNLEEAKLALEQAKTAKENGLTRGRYELEKKRESRARSVERHSKLVSDKALMVLRAPTDGAVYYGRCVDGKWPEVASYAAKLTPFGTVAPNKVLMTIVKQRPLYVLAALGEKELPDFKSGLSALVAPAADDSLEMAGKVTEISTIPGGDKKFAMELEVDEVGAPEWLVAGMTCEAKVTIYENEATVVVPTDLVQTDEDDEKTKYVMLVTDDEDKPVRRDVKLGRKKGKLVEVLEGLDEGDQIVKEEKDDAKDE